MDELQVMRKFQKLLEAEGLTASERERVLNWMLAKIQEALGEPE